MIEYKKGNILAEQAEAIVNTVNCVGVMGRGIALQFKKSYPQNFKAYEAACNKKEVEPGKMFVYQINQMVNPKYIINFPTKRHWRGKSKIEDIKSGLKALAEEIHNRNIKSIAIPPLGCGLGGLNWSDVRGEIELALKNLDDVTIIVFEPNKEISSNNEVNKSSDVPKMTPGRATLISLVYRYLQGLMDPFITLLEIHKLMYFMQEAGQPLKLKYQKALYGPYSENLRHVLNHIEGHLITGFDGEDSPNKPIELVPGAREDAIKFLEKDTETINRFERVAKLVEGFETPFGLELLATVHWIASKEEAKSQEEVVKLVYDWNIRKHQFTERQIKIAYEALLSQNWLSCT